jgi:acyl carrier protein
LQKDIVIDVDAVKAVVVEALGLQDRAQTIDESTPLLGALPELDSLAVVELLVELEEHFGISPDADEMSAEVFETLGSLTAFVQEQTS